MIQLINYHISGSGLNALSDGLVQMKKVFRAISARSKFDTHWNTEYCRIRDKSAFVSTYEFLLIVNAWRR